MAKMAVLQLLKSPKLILRESLVIENSRNLPTVQIARKSTFFVFQEKGYQILHV